MRTLAATVSVAAASLALLAAGLHAGQAGADPGPESGPREVITVRFAGEMANLEAFGTFGSFLFQGNLLSPSGAVVGSLVHRGRCSTTTPPPCLVFEV
ncbi:MAG TPA: hypothetical protein VI854_01020, partial [Acidimicrobiia bacterium]|nr:hypothetical protein [Acidimicrobiia bacterium]